MKNMYHAMPNSPVTTLTSNITGTQTTIPVKQTAKLPPAPNICTIGFDEGAETIIYGGKTATELTDVTRGVEGVQREWTKGTEVTRLYTAYEHDNMVDNIFDLDSMIKNKEDANFLNIQDTRSDNFHPSDYFIPGRSIVSELKFKSAIDNCPVGASPRYVFVNTITGWKDESGGYPIQVAYGQEGIAYRYGISNSDWGDWIETFPTFGSNDNGNYLKYPNGILICWVKDFQLTKQYKDNYYKFDDWVFPAKFNENPTVIPVGFGLYTTIKEASGVVGYGNATTTNVRIYSWLQSGTYPDDGRKKKVNALAIGRWK